MTMHRMYGTQMMSYGASASCANAVSCAHTTSMQSADTIALILDAIIMASIIICGLVIRLSILSISLVLLVVLLGFYNLHIARVRQHT